MTNYELYSLIAQIIGFGLTIAGLYFVHKQLKESVNAREQEKKIKRIEHSIDLAKEYAESIELISIVINDLYVIKDIINSHKSEEFVSFTKAEYHHIFTENNISTLDNFFAQKEIYENCANLLNKFEYFSMKLTTNIVDEEIVYRSLHQTFLLVIKLCYPLISSKNDDYESSKYYQHTIEMYNCWTSRLLRNIKEEIKPKKEINKIKESSKL